MNQNFRQKQLLTLKLFTFLGEKILGIFAGHYKFAWDTSQQLNDQRYMVYTAQLQGHGEEENTNKTQQTGQTVSQSQARSGGSGGRTERQEFL